jgi:predicted peroxiredoxin
LAALLPLLMLVALPHAVQAQDTQVVVHIGQFSNDAHSVTMGLGLANMLQRAGADVTVFVDREGVRLADERQPAPVFGDTDAADLVEKFLEAGGDFLVCPHCAMQAGLDEAHLRDGFAMGDPESITALFMAADKVISY